MAFSFWEIFRGRAEPQKVEAADLFAEARADFQARGLALDACIDLIANAVGRADFRTFEDNKEVFDELWYRWNIEPNRNQNSTMFLHSLVDHLCRHNDALIVSAKRRGAPRMDMYVADAWSLESKSVMRDNRYKSVKVGAFTFDRSFDEGDVMRLKLNNANVRAVLDAMQTSYEKMLKYAEAAYEQAAAQHWKVHVDRVRRGRDEDEQAALSNLTGEFNEFLNSPLSVILEYDGLTYTDVSKAGGGKEQLADTRALVEDVFNLTARAFGIPITLIQGKVEGTKDATERFLSECIDPICDQLQEEIQRKEWTFDAWRAGSYIRVDTSAIRHFDLFENAAAVEKLIGSGAYSINELRRAANQPRLPDAWADAHYMTLNISPMDSQTRKL